MEKFEELLIGYVEKSPHLYNKGCKDYKDEGMKQNSWTSIAFKLGSEPQKVKKRWENLRTCFVRAYRIFNEKLPSGSAVKTKKNSFPYFQTMLWLAPFIRKEKITSSHQQSLQLAKHQKSPDYSCFDMKDPLYIEDSCKTLDEESQLESCSLSTEYGVDGDGALYSQDAYSPSTSNVSLNSALPNPVPITRLSATPRRGYKKKSDLSTAVEAFTALVEHKTKVLRTNGPEINDTGDEAFLRSVISDMNRIKPEHKIKFKCEMMELLRKYSEM